MIKLIARDIIGIFLGIKMLSFSFNISKPCISNIFTISLLVIKFLSVSGVLKFTLCANLKIGSQTGFTEVIIILPSTSKTFLTFSSATQISSK